MTSATFHASAPPAYDVPETLDADLVILPREVDEDGVGLYEDHLTDTVKQLRSEGVKAAYLHGSGEREWIGEKGFTPNEIGFVIAVAGAAGWDSIKMLLSLVRHKDDQAHKRHMKLKAGRYTSHPNGPTTHEWLEIEGSIEDVERAIDKMRSDEIEPGDS